MKGLVVGGGGHFPNLDPARGQTLGGTGLSDNPHSGKAQQGGEQGQVEWGAVRFRGVGGRVSLQARVGCGAEEGCFGWGVRRPGMVVLPLPSSSPGPPERVCSPPAGRAGTESCLSGSPP